MGKDFWTDRSVLKRFFRDFFMRAIEDSKESRSFLSFNKQIKDQESYSPQILIFQGEDGFGKTTSIAQCESIVEEIGAELKKPVTTINIDFEKIFTDNLFIPTDSEMLIDLMFNSFQNNSDISQYFSKYRDYKEKIKKISHQIETFINEEWPGENQEFIGQSETSYQNSFSNWLLTRLSKQDWDLYTNTDKFLSDSIVNGIIDASMDRPFLLSFDNYECLPKELESWFRQKFIKQIYEQKISVVTIISGKGTISRNYRNNFPEELVFFFDFDNLTLTINEISNVSSHMRCNLADNEIYNLETYTSGVPLAAVDVLNCIKNGSSVSSIITQEVNTFKNTREIIQSVADRFLLSDDLQLKCRVFTLAMIDYLEPCIIAQLWGIKDSEVSSTITDLEKKFSFISNKKIHPAVRIILRNFLLNECKNENSEYKTFLQCYRNICKGLASALYSETFKATSAKDRYTDKKYLQTLHNLLNSALWTSIDDAFQFLAGYYIELYYFNPHFISLLLNRFKEFSDLFTPEQNSALKLYAANLKFHNDGLPNTASIDICELSLVDLLEQNSKSMTSFQLAMIAKMKGELKYRSEYSFEAMEEYKKGFELLKDNSIDRSLLFTDFLYLGKKFQSINDLNLSIEAFLFSSSINQNSFLPLYETGLSRIKLSEYGQAVTVLLEAVRINPDHQDAWYNLGLSYSDLQDYETAVESFTKASEKGPSNEFILFEMGKALNKLKRHEEAISAFSKVVTINENHNEAWYIAGLSYSAINNSDEAITAYKKALEINPQMLKAIISLAEEYYTKKNYSESAEMFNNAIKIDSNNYQLWSKKAKVLYEAGDFEKSVEAGKKSVSFSVRELDPWMTLGNAYVALKEYDNAIATFKEASEIEPCNPQIWNLIGKSYFAQNSINKAVQAFSTTIELNPSMEGPWYDLGLCYSAQEKFSEAAQAFKKASEIEPQKSEILMQLGDTNMSLEQFTDAVASYSKAALLNPQSHELFYKKGLACLRIDDLEEAIVSFVKAAEIFNSNCDIWYQMGIAYFSAGHFEEALQAFQTAVSLNSLRPEIWTHLGITKQNLNKYEEAIADFTKTIELSPDDGNPWIRIGSCYYQMQKFKDAVSAFKKALIFEPGNIDIMQQIGLACHAAGDLNTAVDYYRLITEKEPSLAIPWFNMALALHGKGDYEDAIQVYKRAISIMPDNSDIWYNLGLAFHSNNELDESISAYRQAAKLNPENPDIWFHLGIVFNSLEHYGEAIQAYRKVIQISSDNIEAWFNLGLSYYIWGQYDDALEAYEKVIELNPEYYAALANLGTTYYALENYDKTIEFCQKALSFSDDPSTRAYLIISFIKKSNDENAEEQSGILLSSKLSQKDILIITDILKVYQSKNDTNEIIDNLLEKLCISTETEFSA